MDTPPVESGSRPAPGGRRLCVREFRAGYVHGLNNVAEAVRQLRGDGTNQVRGAGVALCTGFGGGYGSAAVLTAPG